MKTIGIAGLVMATGLVGVAKAAEVTGGQTSVALDTAALSAAASLNLTGVSADVIAPGSLPDSVGFAITPRDAAMLPTTFAYDSSDFLGSFSGTIEHQGSVFFDAAGSSVEVGDFTIGFDAARVGTLGGAASGFFVQSNVGIAAILFDVGAPSQLEATDFGLTVGADLLVSPEFASFLQSNGLAASDLSGVDVGDALVEGMTECSGTDVNGNGFVGILDLFGYVNQFFSDDPAADIDGSGEVDVLDLLIFLDRWSDCRTLRRFGFPWRNGDG